MKYERNRRILIVDDTRSIHGDFKKILGAPEGTLELEADEMELFGTTSRRTLRSYELVSAYQGAEAVEQVERAMATDSRFALAFVDMRMPPGWDGLETVERMWRVDPEIQIVICTAYSDYSWEDLVERLGTVDRLLILKKPFDTAEVSQLACALTEKWHLAKQAHLKLSQLSAMVEEQTSALARANEQLRHEVARRRHSEEVLRLSEERFALAAAGSNDGLWDWNLESGESYYSPRWKAMLGLDDAAMDANPEQWYALIHPDDRETVRITLQAHLDGISPHFVSEHRVLHANGESRWVLARGQAVRNAAGVATRIAGSQTDITDRVMVEEQLRHDALHDALTGLPNRLFLMNRLHHCFHAARRDPALAFAVFYLDLDHFKTINDSLGHLVGDELLQQVASRLSQCLRVTDMIATGTHDRSLARLGGDEFVILCEQLHDPSDALRVAERIQAALARPFCIGPHEVRSGASIGITISHAGYARHDDILRDADTALYAAKEAGRNAIRIFDGDMHTRAVARFELERELTHAIANHELVLAYQPIVDLGTGRVIEYEALVRWQHPTRGLISPDRFIPLAEETGLIVPLGSWVLREACRQLAEWRRMSPEAGFAVAVNVGARHLAQDDFADEVEAVLGEAGLAACDLRLEITETALMDTGPDTAMRLERLKSLGVRLHLDDFGTGYSSLTYLHKFPVSALKIDRSFVSAIPDDPMCDSIVAAIINLGRSLDLSVIAEGIETEAQRDRIYALGCDLGQGYAFSRPLMPPQIEAQLRMHRMAVPA